MAQKGRPGLSATEKSELWKRWKSGESLSDIGRALGKHAGSVHTVLSAKGGIHPVARQRSRLALTLNEREEISRGIAALRSVRQIAVGICRAPSTVSREITRHGGRHDYRATEADSKAMAAALRPKPCKLALDDSLQKLVAKKLELDWSPQQIGGWLKRTFPENEGMQVSHETIYRSLFVQARGVLKRELMVHLRSRRMMRRSKHATTEG
jgi:IS30 family transposase